MLAQELGEIGHAGLAFAGGAATTTTPVTRPTETTNPTNADGRRGPRDRVSRLAFALPRTRTPYTVGRFGTIRPGSTTVKGPPSRSGHFHGLAPRPDQRSLADTNTDRDRGTTTATLGA